LESLTCGGAHERLGQLVVGAETLRPPRRRRSRPGDVGVAVAVLDPAAGKHHRSRGEFHCGVAPHQENGNAGWVFSEFAHQHYGRGRPGRQRDVRVVSHKRLRWAARVRMRRAKYRPSITSTAIDWPNAAERLSPVSTSDSKPAATTFPSDNSMQWLKPGGISST